MLSFNHSCVLEPDQYCEPRVKKEAIVLHFTVGTTAEGAINGWRQTSERVGTAYVIDLNGTIHEVFPPDAYAYHLGLKKEAWPNAFQDQRTIGIELVNVGPLIKNTDGDTFYWSLKGFGTPYCKAYETDRYRKVESWRGYTYWASFPKFQMDSLATLVTHLTEAFDIPRVFLPERERLWNTLGTSIRPGAVSGLTRAGTFHGILTHANFRSDKLDIGPAFDWAVIGG